MKTKMLLLSVFLFSIFSADAQIWKNMGKKIEKKIEQKASQRIERQIDKAIDKGLDKVEEAPAEASKSKKNGKRKAKGNQKSTGSGGDDAEWSESDGMEESRFENDDPTPSLQRYSKFTFVPGEEIIAF